MAKTTVTNLLTQLKRKLDYNISDSDLDNLLVDFINDNVIVIKQWFTDRGIPWDSSASSKFMTVAGQDYVDYSYAVITGDATTFTGTAGDTIDVTIDGTAYADIDISGATDIAGVVTAINTAVGSTVASQDDNDCLVITSSTQTTGSVTIADGTSTTQTVIAELFSIEDNRSVTAFNDLDEIIKLTDRLNDTDIEIRPYSWLKHYEPDPSSDSTDTPSYAARWQNYIYFSPRPSDANMVYIDYIKVLSALTSSSTLPFEVTYDPLLKAMVQLDFEKWKDINAVNTHSACMIKVTELKQTLIDGARNIGQVSQAVSRNEPDYTGPRADPTGDFSNG